MHANPQNSPLQISPSLPPEASSGSLITLGNFDGVHLGHQKMLSMAVKQAQKQNLFMAVLGFDPHPRMFLGQQKVDELSTNAQRKQWIESLYPSVQFSVIHFNRAFSQLSAQDFLALLQKHCHMKHLVVGATTHIGKDRVGTPKVLQQLATAMGFEITIVDPFCAAVGDEVISSTYIRSCIRHGQMLEAKKALGRWYETQGVVVQGRGIGKTMGYPTANIRYHDRQFMPKTGVYAAWLRVQQKTYPAAVNWGARPTIDPHEKTNHLEVHLLDASMHLYGVEVQVLWAERVRDEMRFSSVDFLRLQIQKDVQAVHSLLKEYK